MAITTDRVGELIEGPARNRRTIVSPEGVPLDIQVAGNIERISAFLLDITFLLTTIVVLYIIVIMLFFSGTNISVGMTLMLFIAFIVRNCYFLHFELAWQGRTPGKKICGLRVINRSGGELTPSAVIARNLTREVEFFLPVSLFLSLGIGEGFWTQLALFGWVLAIASLPLWGRDHLRAGDLIGGTQVIAMPKRLLLADLTRHGQQVTFNKRLADAAGAAYTFSHEQLAIYGAFELQVLEEFLRRPATGQTDKLLYDVSVKIRRKIGWNEEIPFADIRKFLTDFYAAERAELERDKLYGRLRADKTDRV
jgi:Predicted membrane protein/domain